MKNLIKEQCKMLNGSVKSHKSVGWATMAEKKVLQVRSELSKYKCHNKFNLQQSSEISDKYNGLSSHDRQQVFCPRL